MTINEKKMTIELTAAEMKEARKFGTQMYNALQAARRDYPSFRTAEIKSKRSKAAFAKLTLNEISDYVEKNGSDKQKSDFAFLTGKNTDEYIKSASFFEVKSWFLSQFPELKKARAEHNKKTQAILCGAAA